MKTPEDRLFDLFEASLLGAQDALNKARHMTEVLQTDYFEKTPERLESDGAAKCLFETGYEKIQASLAIIFDYIYEAHKKIGLSIGAYGDIFNETEAQEFNSEQR